MSEVELFLIQEGDNCTIYSIHFLDNAESEFENCLRLYDKILILGNGGAKTTRTYNEDDRLKGYVITLQKFENLLKQGVANGSVTLTETSIETDNIFEL